MASRLESSGLPGRIHIDQATLTAARLRSDPRYEGRVQQREVELKGFGSQTTFLVNPDLTEHYPLCHFPPLSSLRKTANGTEGMRGSGLGESMRKLSLPGAQETGSIKIRKSFSFVKPPSL